MSFFAIRCSTMEEAEAGYPRSIRVPHHQHRPAHARTNSPLYSLPPGCDEFHGSEVQS
jgi:hypothetical protein